MSLMHNPGEIDKKNVVAFSTQSNMKCSNENVMQEQVGPSCKKQLQNQAAAAAAAVRTGDEVEEDTCVNPHNAEDGNDVHEDDDDAADDDIDVDDDDNDDDDEDDVCTQATK